MKEGIHPEYFESKVVCGGCGTVFPVGSTIAEIRVNICSACHPHYTGKSKLLDTEGRVDRFKRKYANVKTPAPAK